ncbi:MAG: GNAT family N-acetyltransferase [Weeksellaceae bacterium]|nr:GNAT family N-acetyltransferase [Weeksellaceae bacterium]
MYNLYIRPLELEDALISYEWRNDPEIWKFTGSRPNRKITKEIETDWISKAINDPFSRRFAIIADNEYIGNIQITNISESSATYHIFIGNKNWWGKGVSKLATFEILHFAKEHLNLNTIYLSVSEENIYAIKSYEASGFVKIHNDGNFVEMKCDLDKLPIPMVSIFVMVYNHEKYISDCLEGILKQKCNFPYNIVIGEDFSTDKSREIIERYNKNYPGKLKLLLHDKNIGAHANQMAILENCNGKYIAICEGDDYWTDSGKLQRQVDFLENNSEYVLVAENSRIIDERHGTETLFAQFDSPRNITIEEMIRGRKFHTATVLFKRSALFLPNNFSDFPFGDTILFVTLAKKGSVKLLPNISTIYRRNQNGVSTGYNRYEWAKKVERFNLMLDDFLDNQFTKLHSANVAKTYYSVFKWALKNYEFKLAQKSLFKFFTYKTFAK